MKIKSILAAGLLSFLFIGPVLAQTTAPTSPLVAPMQQAATKLKALQPTGDPDFDYVFRMRLMAQGAIDMAKVAAA
jgi:uncharacterized protein (DUF305 family)